MKIGMFLSQFPAISETFILNQISGCIAAGFELDILARNINQLPEDQKQQIHRTLKNSTYHINIRVSHLELIRKTLPKAIFKKLINSIITKKSRNSIHKTISPFKFDYDLVHAQFGTVGQYAITLKENGLIKAPVLTAFRGVDATAHPLRHGKDCYKKLFEKGDLFLPSCHFLAKKLIKLGCPPSKIKVLYSGIEIPHEDLLIRKNRNEKIKLVSVGRLVEKKGFKDSIVAAAQLKQRKIPFYYEIIGDGSQREELHSLIESNRLAGDVNLVGAKSNEYCRKMLSESDICLCPAIEAQNGDADGAANVPKEALAFETPVISTDAGGLTEVVVENKTGITVAQNNPSEIAEAIIYLFENPTIAESLAKQGRQHTIDLFDNKEINRQLLAAYIGTCSK